MRTIAQTVKQAIQTDNVALEALERGILNLSAYARHIQPKVEKWLWKEVNTAALVVALSRLQQEKQELLSPRVGVKDMTIQTGITEFVFENTVRVQRKISDHKTKIKNKFFVSMHGMDEVSVLMKNSDAINLTGILKRDLKKQLVDLVAITVRLNDSAIDTPNIFYSLMKPMIAKQINIIEIVTGLAEITFVVSEKDQQAVVEGLKTLQETERV